jgi:hypothetical protein
VAAEEAPVAEAATADVEAPAEAPADETNSEEPPAEA